MEHNTKQAEEITSGNDVVSESVTEKETEPETPSDAQAEFYEQYKNLPVWKQVVILVLFIGGMTAVIMLINFIVEFGAEIIRALLK